MKKINKKTILKLRDKDKLSFVEIATQFKCSKQGVHNMYYREKAKELLPITITERFVDGHERVYILETMEEVREDLKDGCKTLVSLVNEVIENRFIESGESHA